MAFSETLKIEIRKRSHHSCCLCKTVGIEIHHIIPQENGGEDVIENAAPLCPSCHETYGANPTKRKMIKEARDQWFEICAQRYASDSDRIEELIKGISQLREHLFTLPSISDMIAEAVISRLSGQGLLASDENGLALSKILERLCSSSSKIPSSNAPSIDATYALIFETEGEANPNDIEFNEIRGQFLATYGKFVARQFCSYLVFTQQINWMEGHTEDEMARHMQIAFIGMVMMLNHHELGEVTCPLKIDFNEKGEIRAAAIMNK